MILPGAMVMDGNAMDGMACVGAILVVVDAATVGMFSLADAASLAACLFFHQKKPTITTAITAIAMI